MKNSSLIFIIVVVLGLGGLGYYYMTSSNEANNGSALLGGDAMEKGDSMEGEAMGKDDAMVADDDKMMAGEDKMAGDSMEKDAMEGEAMAKGGQYVEYSPEVLNSSANTRRVLFFYANWCPTCKPSNADFQKNVSQLPDDVTVIRVNYNDNQTDSNEEALADQYGVTYQHTFVQIDSQGNAVTRWNGGQTAELLSNIK